MNKEDALKKRDAAYIAWACAKRNGVSFGVEQALLLAARDAWAAWEAA